MPWHTSDLEPPFAAVVTDGPGGPGVNLTGATARAHFRKPSGVVLARDAVLADQVATPGRVTMAWQAGDLNESGRWVVEVELTTGGRAQTVGPGEFTVQPQIA